MENARGRHRAVRRLGHEERVFSIWKYIDLLQFHSQDLKVGTGALVERLQEHYIYVDSSTLTSYILTCSSVSVMLTGRTSS